MARNWNNIWRYIHLSLGIVLVIPSRSNCLVSHNGFVDSVVCSGDKFISTIFIFFVMWSGLAKWPIYPWYKNGKTARSARQRPNLQIDVVQPMHQWSAKRKHNAKTVAQ